MEVIPTELRDVVILKPKIYEDARGSFVKTYHQSMFREWGLSFEPVEEFFSVSVQNVLRGMHFQRPPQAAAKLVYCIAGRVLDVVLDLRRDSATFGRCTALELDDCRRFQLFIPAGFAHGFLTLSPQATMVYLTSALYVPTLDAGLLWNSFGFDWPVRQPILSDRDQQFPAWPEFATPF